VNPQPKQKVTLLKGKKYTQFKRDLYHNRAYECCESCQRWVPLEGSVFEVAHLSHIVPRKRGGDIPSNVLVECYRCHIIKKHGLKWSNGKRS